MNKPLSIAPAIVALVFSATMPLRGQSALNRFDPNANGGAGNGSERITESVRKALIAGPATPTPSPPPQMVSLSTRMRVQTGINVGVAGFIITGSAPKRVLVRAIGPSLTQFGVPDALADPTLDLDGPDPFVMIINDNWRDTQEAEIQATGIPPTNDLESAIVVTLAPGSYVATVRGKNNTSGLGLIEVYDLDPSAASRLANLSTRAFVSTGSDIVIAGFLLFGKNVPDRIVVRGIGPSLTAFGVPNALDDPTLELRDSNGSLLIANNDWQDNPAQAAELVAAGLAPTNNLESGIAALLPPGLYTVLLVGLNNGTGLGVVEVYDRGVGGPAPTPTPTPSATPSGTPTPPGATPSPTSTPTITPGGTPTPTPPPPVITSPLDVTVIVGQPFVYQFEAPGATSLAVFNLPPGLAFNSTLRAIVGNPTAPGTFSTGLSAMNAGGTTTATLTISVQPPPSPGPAFISSTASGGRTGQLFSFQVMTTGGSPAVRLTAAGLPTGLAADSITGVIFGVPTTDGSSAVTLTVTDGSITTTSTLQLTFTSNPAVPVIISPNSAPLFPGQFFSYTIMTDAPGPTSFAFFGTLPAGLTFDAVTGTISGTYPGPLGKGAHGEPPKPEQTGGYPLTAIQLFATNKFSGDNFTFSFLFRDAPTGVRNISTLTKIFTPGDVVIDGFIITGNTPKVVLVRAIGPSLTDLGVPDALPNPTLQLRDNVRPENHYENDNWKDNMAQRDYIRLSGLCPSDPLESAILIALEPGTYSAIVSGRKDPGGTATTGTATVDVFDLGAASLNTPPPPPTPTPHAELANLSTRGFVTRDFVMIGGFIVQDPGPCVDVVVRVIGPSLADFGISNFVANPTLELYRDNALIYSNNDWSDWPRDPLPPPSCPGVFEIPAGLKPTHLPESAMAVRLPPGQYTAFVGGNPDTTPAVAVIQVYVLP
jgi:hypothetical protein